MKNSIELIHGDCIEGMRSLKEGSVDVIATSPPYNIGIAYSTYNDKSSREDYLDWCSEWGREVARLMHEASSLFLNVGASPKNPLAPHQLALRFSEFLVLQNTFHWIKSITVEPKGGEAISAGHFKPINSKRYVNDCHEYVFHFTQTGNVPLDRRAVGVPYQDKSNITRWGHTDGEDRRCRGNTWFIPYKTIVSRDKERPHPASFPPALIEQCIRIHGGKPAETCVLDPFVGIGSSAIAAKNCDVGQFIGFDIDQGYLDVAKERIREEA